MANQIFDAIIIGGSYSGLSAGMALGRALRQVLIIDSGNPAMNKLRMHTISLHTTDQHQKKSLLKPGNRLQSTRR